MSGIYADTKRHLPVHPSLMMCLKNRESHFILSAILSNIANTFSSMFCAVFVWVFPLAFDNSGFLIICWSVLVIFNIYLFSKRLNIYFYFQDAIKNRDLSGITAIPEIIPSEDQVFPWIPGLLPTCYHLLCHSWQQNPFH